VTSNIYTFIGATHRWIENLSEGRKTTIRQTKRHTRDLERSGLQHHCRHRLRSNPDLHSFVVRAVAHITTSQTTTWSSANRPYAIASTDCRVDLRLPRLGLPNDDDTDRLGYTIGCSLVAIFWWSMVARRTTRVDDSLAVSFYVTSTVLLGFLCPLMIFLNVLPIFDNVRPAGAKTPLIIGLIAHVTFYILVFFTTYWFTRIADRPSNSGKPSDGHGVVDNASPDG